MAIGYKLKHYLFNAFRELFIYHHSSLEFRAKVFALIIAANEHASDCEYSIVKKAGVIIYNEEDRANTLTLTTQEFVHKVHEKNGMDIDMLVQDIVKELKIIPRYAKKIDIGQLQLLLSCHEDEDTLAYQSRMIEFMERLKNEYEAKNQPS
ncbi:MAG: hypothetical protein R3302_03015 [Sulfurimonadaceae bacterium]|nr:hypothetical protein [Sulfurimonadaceae bacterium]